MESDAFRISGAAANAARIEYECAFRAYMAAPAAELLQPLLDHYDRWRGLLTQRMAIAYYDQYHLLPHEPGAP